MREYGSATLTALQARAGIVSRVLIWFSARNRATNAVETMGLWTGADHEYFTISAASRLYYGAGNVMDIPQLTYQSGLAVRIHRIGLSPLTPEVMQLIRGYDVKSAPVEIHRALYSTDTRLLIEEPHRVLTGFVDEVDLGTPAAGGTASCVLGIATSARVLTQDLAIKKSDETQRLRLGDRMRRWGDVSGAVDVWWGATRKGGGS